MNCSFLHILLLFLNDLKVKTLLLIYVFLISISASAQEPIYNFLDEDDGLNTDIVYDIHQDKNGVIWLGTDKGVSSYNGYEFKNYTMKDGLPGLTILQFVEMPDGKIWGYCHEGKAFFSFETDFKGFTPYKYNNLVKKEFGVNFLINSFYVDKEESLHIGGFKISGEVIINKYGIVSKPSKKANTFLQVFLTPKSQYYDFYFINTDSKLNTKFSTKKKPYSGPHIKAVWLQPNKSAVFMNNGIEVVFKNKPTEYIKTLNKPIALERIDSTHFFVGFFNGGAKIINSKTKAQKTFLKGKIVSNFLIDHEGNYWFTTIGHGIAYVKNPEVLSYKTANYPPLSLAKNSNNELYIGYSGGKVLKRNINGIYKTITAPNNGTFPTLVEVDASNNLYTINNGFLKNHTTGVTVNVGYAFNLSTQDSKSLLISSTERLVEIEKDTIKHTKIPTRVYDAVHWKGGVVIGGSEKKIFKKIKDSILLLDDKEELLKITTTDIDVNKEKDKLFIASRYRGIVIYSDSLCISIKEKEGLFSNVVNELYIENSNTIWACTDEGLNRIVFTKDNEYTIDGINKKDGLLSNRVTDLEIVKDTLWVATKKGLNSFSKKLLNNKPLPKKCFLQLKEVNVNENNIDQDSVKEYKYNLNNFEFIIQGISFSKKDKLIYKYRLKGSDNLWRNTPNRTILYSSLPPGNYCFEAKACENNICSDELISYSFTIFSPFWKTWWFYCLCALVFFLAIYSLFKINLLSYNKYIQQEIIKALFKRINKKKFIIVRVLGKDVKILEDEIVYIKSFKDYVEIHLTNNTKHVCRSTLKKILTQLDPKSFMQIHRSYIVHKDKITSIAADGLTVLNNELPIGKTYKETLKQYKTVFKQYKT